MRATHYITIAVAITLIALLYWGGNTVPPVKKVSEAAMPAASSGAMSQGPNTMKPASSDSMISASKSQLPKTAADSVSSIENKLSAMHDSSRMAVVFTDLSGLYERNKQVAVATYYKGLSAKLEKSGKNLTFAGQIFLQLMESESSSSVQMWEAQQAVSCLEQALALDPGNEDTKLALATGYIEGTGEPMRGVQILLAITRENPDDIPANLLLGKMSIQSGQFDKAVGRFEKLLKLQPDNTEVMFFLAEAYEGTGNKAKAIAMLEQCKQKVNNPGFSKEIDEKLKSLK